MRVPAIIAGVGLVFAAGGALLLAQQIANGQALNARTAAVCRHGEDESAANRAQRLQALAVAAAINRAEGQQARQTRQYAPLTNLGALPATPPDFTLKLYADGDGYATVLKDARDPCRYVIFSDHGGHIYETSSPAQIAD